MSEMQFSPDTLAWVVLLRRIFGEVARSRPPGWLSDQVDLAEADLYALRSADPSIELETIELAVEVITKLLAGIVINPT